MCTDAPLMDPLSANEGKAFVNINQSSKYTLESVTISDPWPKTLPEPTAHPPWCPYARASFSCYILEGKEIFCHSEQSLTAFPVVWVKPVWTGCTPCTRISVSFLFRTSILNPTYQQRCKINMRGEACLGYSGHCIFSSSVYWPSKE